MLKMLLVIFTVPLLLVGGLQGYLWYETKEKAKQLTSMLYPIVGLNYRSIHASILGSVGLNNVSVTPAGSNDTFNIDSIRINSSDILDLYKIKSKLEAGEIPESLSLSFNGFRASLYSDFMLQSTSSSLFGPFDSQGCGDIKFIGPEQLEAMGYTKLEGDIWIGYEFNAASESLKIQVRYEFQDMMAIFMEVVFAANQSPSLVALQSESPKLSYAKLTLEDQSYQDRKKQYCAEQSNITPEKFIVAHVDRLQQSLSSSGISVNPELIEGYKRFLQQPGQINISTNPDFPLNLAQLQFYKPGDLVKLLNLQVQINDTPVNNLAIDFTSPRTTISDSDPKMAVSQQIPHMSAAEQTTLATETASVAIKATVPRQVFNPTPVSELSRHLGKTARIKITNGRLYQGKINDVTDESLNIITRLSGGTATFYVPFDRIAEVSVLY